MPSNVEDDQQGLIANEQQQPLDNDFGNIGVIHDETDDYIATDFTAAILPEPVDDTPQHFHNVQLPDTELLLAEPPIDRYNYTYIIFYLLGITTMTPWNFFITAEDYWMYKFRNTTLNETEISPDLTPMQKSFTCDLTLTASISGTTFLILNAIYGQHISHNVKMLGTLFMIVIIFIITTAFVEVNTDSWQEQFFLITLFTVVIINIASSIMSGGIFSIASLFPSKYMAALVSGQALGGILTAVAFILVLAVGLAPKITAFIYFIIGTVLVLLCIITYMVMTQQAFYRYYIEGTAAKYEILYNTPSTSRKNEEHKAGGDIAPTGVSLEPNLFEVFSKIYMYAVSITLLFATSLSVYPAVTVLMQSEHFGEGYAWNDIYYMPVVNYLFFNTGDYIGRILAGLFQIPTYKGTLLLMTVVRMVFIPFFLCSNTNLHNFLPILVESDVSFMIMIITFALSNGYLTNLLLILAPNCCLQHEKEMASSIMVACLSCGLAFGSLISMLFVQML